MTQITNYKHNQDDVSFITIKNKNGLEVVLSTFGASIYSIKFNEQFLTYSPRDIETFLTSDSFFGKSVGPICGRIKDHKIDIDGKDIMLHSEKDILLHSGKFSISFSNFDYEIISSETGTKVIFSLETLDPLNDGLFSGTYKITYFINDNNELILNHEVTSLNKAPYSITNHTYFILDNLYNSKDYLLYLDANKVGRLDEDLLLQEKVYVNALFDFRNAHKIGDFIDELLPISARGYDHPYYFKNHSLIKPKIILESKDYRLEICTDYNGAVIYTNNYFMDEIMNDNVENHKHASIAIEPQIAPFNFKEMLINSNSTRSNVIKYRFIRK